MTPDLLAVVARSSQALAELIDALDQEGGAYVRAYAEHVLTSNGGNTGPKRPSNLPPEAGALIREMVLDSAVVVRTYRSPA
jgi:hypothetical protein